MPSPFLGMDPYIEGDLWTSIHSQLGAEIARQLAPKLRPRYLALTEKRFIMDTPDEAEVTIEGSYPDVVMPAPIPHTWVEIRDVAKRRLVTMIEFLSPTNKRGDGRKAYLKKRRRLLLSSAHLLEIDLLRKGRRVPMLQPLPSASYFVMLSRAGRRPLTEVWPITLDQSLPTVPVPLLPDDADVSLDLQLAFTNSYDLLGYDLAVDYGRPPEIPLSTEADAWMDQRLRAAGRRP